MKVRTRFVISFAYVLLVVIVALTVPLGIALRDRARSEVEALALTNAQSIAALLDGDRLEVGKPRDRLARDIDRFASDVGGRVVVLDAEGTVLADSDGQDIGQRFATSGRPEVRDALDATASVGVRDSQDLGAEIVVAAAPVIDGGALVGAVRTSRDVAQAQRNVTRATFAIVAVAGAGLLAGLALAFVLAGSLARPLSRLAAAAQRLGRGDLHTRTGLDAGTDEVGELTRSFDEMAGRLERTMVAQREFVANASHQLRTPLTGMKLRLGSAMAITDDKAVRNELAAADSEVERLAGIVQRLLVMAKEVEEGQATHVDLADAVTRGVERWHDRAARAGASISQTGGPVVALASPSDIDQVLDVLVDNAVSYAPGPVEVRTTRDGARATLVVHDHGGGIPSDQLAKVSERFYRGSNASTGGSGLGLAIAKELVERWGGTIAVTSPDDDGTRVEIVLRAVDV